MAGFLGRSFRERINGFGGKLKEWVESWSGLINIGLFIATVCLAYYAARQWKAANETFQEIQKQTPAVIESAKAASAAAKVAEQTLNEMKNGGTATDTHTLASQAVVQSKQTTTLAEESKVQAQTAQDSESALLAMQRAFVFPNLSFSDLHGPYIGGRAVVVEWKNSGTTPTKAMTARIAMGYRVPTLEDYDLKTNSEKLFTVHKFAEMKSAYVPPSGILVMPELYIYSDEMYPISQGSKHLHVWGFVTYHDVFHGSKEHQTRFCYEIFNSNEIGPPALRLVNNCSDNCYDDSCPTT